jgi:hypothetical protein
VSDKMAPSQMDFKLSAFNAYSRLQPAWLSVKHRIKPPREKEGHLHKFLGWTQSQMLQKLERAQEITNRDVKCTVHSEEVLSIEC